jgi:hypothetical protein
MIKIRSVHFRTLRVPHQQPSLKRCESTESESGNDADKKLPRSIGKLSKEFQIGKHRIGWVQIPDDLSNASIQLIQGNYFLKILIARN